MILRYSLFWFVLMVVAILNGIMRQTLFHNLLGELSAHQLSTVTGILLVFFAVWLINKKWKIEARQQALYIGFIWLIMTILFEFVLGHFVMGHSWTRLFFDYNIFAGRVWLFFLLSLVFIPLIVYLLDRKS